MSTEYHVKLIQAGNTQTLTIPQELNLSTTEVIIRQERRKTNNKNPIRKNPFSKSLQP